MLASFMTAMIHAFRMPGFFILSGYFSMMVLERTGNGPWIRSRMVRLGIPLVLGTLLLGTVEIAIRDVAYVRSGVPITTALADTSLNGWVNHRWFLATLLLFCATLALAAAILGRDRIGRVAYGAGEFLLARGWGFAAVMLVIASYATRIVSSAIGDAGGGSFLQGQALFYGQYALFFALGVALFANEEAFRWFRRLDAQRVVSAVVATAAYVASYFALYAPGSLEGTGWGEARKYVSVGVEGIAGLLLCAVFYALLDRYANVRSSVVRYFVDASYTIYLVHILFVYAFGAALMGVFLPAAVEYVLVIVGVLLLSVLAYEVARNIPVLGWVLNGARYGPRGGTGLPGSQLSRGTKDGGLR